MLTDDRILKQQPDFFPMSAQGDPRDWPATTLKRDSQFQSKACIQFLMGTYFFRMVSKVYEKALNIHH